MESIALALILLAVFVVVLLVTGLIESKETRNGNTSDTCFVEIAVGANSQSVAIVFTTDTGVDGGVRILTEDAVGFAYRLSRTLVSAAAEVEDQAYMKAVVEGLRDEEA